MGLSAKACERDSQAVVVTLNGEGVRLALEMMVAGENYAVGVPEVGAEGEVGGVWKLRIQTPGALGSTIAQRPAADRLGSTIHSPPQPEGRFFWPT